MNDRKDLTDDRKTDTTYFLMPVLGIKREYQDLHNFIDSFLDDIGKQQHYINCIYILYRPTDMDSFQDFLEIEKERYQDVIDDYDYAGGYVVVVYKFPKELIPDMNLILNGKYSETSLEFRKKFAQVKRVVAENGLRKDLPSFQWLVFKKSNDVRDSWAEEFGIIIEEGQEVWGVPDMNKQILDIEEIRKREETNA